jgi:hypothetical protein
VERKCAVCGGEWERERKGERERERMRERGRKREKENVREMEKRESWVGSTTAELKMNLKIKRSILTKHAQNILQRSAVVQKQRERERQIK